MPRKKIKTVHRHRFNIDTDKEYSLDDLLRRCRSDLRNRAEYIKKRPDQVGMSPYTEGIILNAKVVPGSIRIRAYDGEGNCGHCYGPAELEVSYRAVKKTDKSKVVRSAYPRTRE